MSIADRLREERESRGLTQPAVADCVGSTKRTVQHWESGASAPTAGDLAQMALLGFDVRYIVTGSRDYAAPEPLSAEEQVLLLHWRAASRDTRNAALGALIGAASSARTKQVFNAPVGGVAQGQATVGPVTIHQAGAPYRVATKRAPKKP